MKMSSHVPAALLQQIDLGNTIFGGMSMTSIDQIQNETEHIISVNTPGLNAHNYSIELKNNVLFVMSNFSTDESSESKRVNYLVKQFQVSSNVDMNNISAEFEEGTLKIVLPYNEFKSEFTKHIEIH